MLTEHFKRHRSCISRIDVFVQSQIVAMGVSVAGLALGGLIKAHADEDVFRRAIASELAARHVVGLSTDVLRGRSSSTG